MPMGLNHQLLPAELLLNSWCWAFVCWRLCWLLLFLRSGCFQCGSSYLHAQQRQHLDSIFLTTHLLHLLPMSAHPQQFVLNTLTISVAPSFQSSSYRDWTLVHKNGTVGCKSGLLLLHKNKAFATVVRNSSLLLYPSLLQFWFTPNKWSAAGALTLFVPFNSAEYLNYSYIFLMYSFMYNFTTPFSE